MRFLIAPLPPTTILVSSFIRKFRYGSTGDERGYVAQVVKRANYHQCRIHVLHDESRPYGFVAMSLSDFNKRPAIVLEYLFVSQDQRGVRHKDLGAITAGEYLLQYGLQQARAINHSVPVSYFTLESAHERLNQYYLKKDFEQVGTTNWMFISL